MLEKVAKKSIKNTNFLKNENIKIIIITTITVIRLGKRDCEEVGCKFNHYYSLFTGIVQCLSSLYLIAVQGAPKRCAMLNRL